MTEPECVYRHARRHVYGWEIPTAGQIRREIACSHSHAAVVRRRIEIAASTMIFEFLNWPSRSEPVPEWRTR